MNRFCWGVENQWRYLGEGPDIRLLYLAFCFDQLHAGLRIGLGGFVFGLTYWRRKFRLREWEPIETDGWAGPIHIDPEPQGREHGA